MITLYNSLVGSVRQSPAARPVEQSGFIRVFYYLRRGYKVLSFMACMIVGETFERLIRMNDRLDVAVSWEGPNPRPGDCHPMFPRCLLLSTSVRPPFLFSRCFSHSLTSPSSFLPFAFSVPLLLVSASVTHHLAAPPDYCLFTDSRRKKLLSEEASPRISN